MASIIQCCRYCAPPKRHPGCHGTCLEYRYEKALHDERKAIWDQNTAINGNLTAQMLAGINKANKRRKGGSR